MLSSAAIPLEVTSPHLQHQTLGIRSSNGEVSTFYSSDSNSPVHPQQDDLMNLALPIAPPTVTNIHHGRTTGPTELSPSYKQHEYVTHPLMMKRDLNSVPRDLMQDMRQTNSVCDMEKCTDDLKTHVIAGDVDFTKIHGLSDANTQVGDT